MIYNYDAIMLWLRGRISFISLRTVLRTRQVAVCGRGGSYGICRKFGREHDGQ